MVPRKMPGEIEPLDEEALNYRVEYTYKPFTFEVKRKSDLASLFKLDSDLIFKDQYIQFSTSTPAGTNNDRAKTYGLGESTRLEQALQSGTTKTLWAVDIPAAGMYNNLYGQLSLLCAAGRW